MMEVTMEQNEVNEPSTSQGMARSASITLAQGKVMDSPPAQEMPCPTCAGAAASMPMSYIYALGRIEARFPRLSVEKEFAQAARRAETAGKIDPQVFIEILSKPENRYLVGQMCWVFTIQGLETYILQPRNPADFDLLVGAIRPVPSPNDIDIVVGVRGPIALPEMCNGLMVPIVGFDQIYSFNRKALIKSIPRLENIAPGQFCPGAEEVFDGIIVRYPVIYAKAAEEFARDSLLTGVGVRPSPLSGTRRVVDVIFCSPTATPISPRSFLCASM
jgi:hypothetical protein